MQPLSSQLIALDTWALQKLFNCPYKAVTANLLRNSKRYFKAKMEAMDILLLHGPPLHQLQSGNAPSCNPAMMIFLTLLITLVTMTA